MRIPIVAALLALLSSALGQTSLERLHAEFPTAFVGRVLIEERNCHRCHGEGPSTGAPILDEVSQRLRPEAIQRRILSPSGNMPSLLHQLDPDEQQASAKAIAHYLTSLSTEPLPSTEPGDAANGRTLYHQVGCVACHGPDKAALAQVATDFRADGLVAFLKDPLATHPSGRMPNLQLTHDEARDLTAYLLDGTTGVNPHPVDRNLIASGHEAYQKHGCATCHQPTGKQAHPWAKLDQGCLSKEAGPWPTHSLTDWQRDAITAALRATDQEERPILKSLVQNNCLACHERDGLGGVPEALDSHFTSSNLNLGDQSRLPPPLTGIGAKLNPKWLLKVLQQGESVRPYMHTRMPIYPREAMAILAKHFSEQDTALPLAEKPPLEERDARQAGHQLVGVKGFGCVACHTFKGQSTTTLNALDLTSLTARLQKPWFQQYMLSPATFQPLTIMPSYWPNGVSTRPDILDGAPNQQIEALWEYLRHGRDARSPEGLKREPILLTVGDEAVMLRRNYPDIGKRGIGVGYPTGIHLTFDAGQMRLASIWTGEFVEASGAFRGQGSGHVHPRSRHVFKFPTGPAFAKLTNIDQPWPDSGAKKAEGFQFRGYDLDKRRRPTFRYDFEGMTIKDKFMDKTKAEANVFFERHLTFNHSPTSVYFRAASGEAIAVSDTTYNIDGKIRIGSSQPAHVSSTTTGKELIIPLSGQSLTLTYQLLNRK